MTFLPFPGPTSSISSAFTAKDITSMKSGGGRHKKNFRPYVRWLGMVFSVIHDPKSCKTSCL